MAKTRPARKSKANVKDDPGLMQFLDTQEKLTKDYVSNPRGTRKYRPCVYTLVRDPKGNYCMVSEKERPKLIDDPVQVMQLTGFLNDLNDLLTEYLAKHVDGKLNTGPGVHVGTTEIFPN